MLNIQRYLHDRLGQGWLVLKLMKIQYLVCCSNPFSKSSAVIFSLSRTSSFNLRALFSSYKQKIIALHDEITLLRWIVLFSRPCFMSVMMRQSWKFTVWTENIKSSHTSERKKHPNIYNKGDNWAILWSKKILSNSQLLQINCNILFLILVSLNMWITMNKWL